MRKGFLYGFLIMVLVVTTILSACGSNTTSPAATATISTTSTAPVSSSQGKWWDKFGTPQYGGMITIAVDDVLAVFDPYPFQTAGDNYQFEPLFVPDWTVDREIWGMQTDFVPTKYFQGRLAESWEMTDPQTLTVHLRKGIRWQNKAPVNGREFTAEDVVFHYDRELGTGSGYTQGSAMASMLLADWVNVTATDKYTFVVHFKKPCSAVAFYSVSDQAAINLFEAPEWVNLAGTAPVMQDTASTPIGDWKNAVGTGAWILTDFLVGTQRTYSRNTEYWGYDPRYPENQLPYADTLKLLAISDSSTKLAALRTGKIDVLGGNSWGAPDIGWQSAKTLANYDLEYKQMAVGPADGVVFRNDAAPFTDIRVRKALDMAIDRDAIAKNVYGGAIDGTPTGMISAAYTGWCYAYDDWSQSLKDEYAYNPTAAKQLLADAGFLNGFKTNVVTSGSMNELLEVYKAYFLDIGVEMDINVMDQTAFTAFTREGKHDQMAESNAGNSWRPTRTIEQYYSKGIDSGTNHINDPAYDAIRDKFWSATTEAEASAAMVEADKHAIEQHYGIFVVHDPGYAYWQPYLKGYSGEARGLVTFSYLWVDQTLKKSLGR